MTGTGWTILCDPDVLEVSKSMWQVLVLILVSVAAVVDIKYRRIPNCLTLAGVISGLILHTVTTGWAGFLFSFQGAVAGLLLLFIPFVLGGIGAGDVKLLAAIGALGGTGFVATTALCMAVVGGVLALGTMLWYGQLAAILNRLLWDGCRLVMRLQPAGKPSNICFPYGIAIALGTFITLTVW